MARKIIIACLFAGAVSFSYFYGLVSHKYKLAPFPQLMEMKDHLFPLKIGYSNVSSKVPVKCSDISREGLAVVLVFGQSQTGNHGETVYQPRGEVYNFFRGLCYRARDPLLGPTGDSGNVFSRLGDMMIDGGLCRRVLLVPIGVGTTTISSWTEGGYLHPRILDAISKLKARDFTITHLLWHQGGSEKYRNAGKFDKEEYKGDFIRMLRSIREQGVDAPAYVAVSTFDRQGIDKNIQAAQRELVNPGLKIFPGPDRDLLTAEENRWEYCHFSHIGLEKMARAWFEALKKNAK